MDAVDAVDVGVPAREVHRLVARCPAPSERMARTVVRAGVGFGLDQPGDNPAFRQLAHQIAPEQVPGDLRGIAQVEFRR